jgi:regulator of sigma E protease
LYGNEGGFVVSYFDMIVPFIVILCAMVVIHEFGHFIVAKMLGIEAEVFSVGFGPRLFGFKLGETDFRFSAIPLGGYVRFKGENLELLQGKSDAAVDEFLAHPGWKRLLVALAGPVFNIVTAILIPTAAILIGFEDDVINSQQVVIGDVRRGSPAEIAGVQKGDRIVSYNHRLNPTWRDIQDEVLVRLDEEVPLTVERSGQLVNLKLKPRVEKMGKDLVGRADLEPPLDHVVVTELVSKAPAERAGIKIGDKITAVNNIPIYASSQIRSMAEKGEELTLNIDRKGEKLTLVATPEKEGEVFLLGVRYQRPYQPVQVKADSLATALSFGWDYNLRILRMSVVIFKQMFSGRRSARDVLGGPVRIAKETADTYKEAGWGGTIRLMGLLSLNLGIFNLLPIPVLDGGMILLIIVEWIFGLVGLTLTMNMRERFQQVGFVLVLLLMGFVLVNDVLNVLPR